MSESTDLQNERTFLAENEIIDKDGNNEPNHFFGSDRNAYSKIMIHKQNITQIIP